ncbi:MAG: alpha/beta hydrolase [Cyanobacteria bacterium P01_G01_bin.38]
MSNSFSHGYALLIGVGQSNYADWSLPVTVKDVSALHAILTDASLCGYPDDADHIRVLCNEAATRQGILDGLQWLQTRTQADSEATAIVYYSGHGWLDQSSQRYYLIPHDIKPHKPHTSALPAEDFAQVLQAINAQKLLVVLDCCHAEGIMAQKGESEEPDLPDGFAKTSAKGQFARLAEGKGIAILSSSDNDQLSWIRKDQTCSIFTYHLIDALRGGDNQPGDTEVTFMNLVSYLGKTVPAAALSDWNAEQQPQWEGKGSNHFPIALICGGKGLPNGGLAALDQAPENTTRSTVIASGERSVSVGGSVQGSTIITGDRNVVGNGNVNQQGNTHLNVHNFSNFPIRHTIYSNVLKDEEVEGKHMSTDNLKIIRQLVQEALGDDELLDLCQDDFPAVHYQFTSGQTKSARIRLLIGHATRHKEIPKLLACIREINPTVCNKFMSQHGDLAAQAAGDVPSYKASSGYAETSDSPTTKNCDVLVLAANPKDTDRLQLDREATLIRQRLQEGNLGREYSVQVEQAVRVEEFSRYLLQHKPTIVHFAGHGSLQGEIILENNQNRTHPVSIEALSGLFAAIQGQIECVVLNACFSLKLADTLAEQVCCVIGIDKAIDDEAAISFAAGFYRGLGFGRGYYKAFELGRNEIQLLKLPDGDLPRFITHDMTLMDTQDDPQSKQTRITRSFVSHATARQTATLYPLWYGTNRKLIDVLDVSKGFSSERDTQLHYGSCQVAVPKSHKIGSTGSAWWQRLLTLTDDRLRLGRNSLEKMAQARFWMEIRHALQNHDVGNRMALIFIHGFNVSFESAALRAAQIGFDLQMPGMTAFYSWPSKGNLTGYTADEASIQASEPYIAQFLTQFVTQSGAEKVHIIAHSMGNRGLLRSIQRIMHQAKGQSGVSFGQIFLAAPDEDPDVFRDLAKVYQTVAERTTLYISAKDKALTTSGIIHDYPRAGFAPPVTIVPGVDTVEVSNIDLTLLGHGYYGDARELLQDMHSLLRYDTPPKQRFGLREELTQNNSRYWVIGS